MKKIIFASLASLIFSMGAMAQTTTPPAADKKADMKGLRKDIRDAKKDKTELKKEVKEGDKDAAKNCPINRSQYEFAFDRGLTAHLSITNFQNSIY